MVKFAFEWIVGPSIMLLGRLFSWIFSWIVDEKTSMNDFAQIVDAKAPVWHRMGMTRAQAIESVEIAIRASFWWSTELQNEARRRARWRIAVIYDE